ncbi:MAG TPA: hypothetical protein VIM64_23660 [Puia sp.]
MATPTTGLTDTTGGSRVPASVAQLLIGTYKNEEGWPPDKTRAVWFSLSSIIDIQALINENGGDGVRIYFGKYPADVDVPGTPDPAYKGKVTVVFIPTVTAADGSHTDIFPPIAPGGAVALDDGTGYNHGSLCPPNCSQTPPPTNP